MSTPVVTLADGQLLEVRRAHELQAGDVLHGRGGRRVVQAVHGSGSWRRVVVTTTSGTYWVQREVLAAHEFIVEPRLSAAS